MEELTWIIPLVALVFGIGYWMLRATSSLEKDYEEKIRIIRDRYFFEANKAFNQVYKKFEEKGFPLLDDEQDSPKMPDVIHWKEEFEPFYRAYKSAMYWQTALNKTKDRLRYIGLFILIMGLIFGGTLFFSFVLPIWNFELLSFLDPNTPLGAFLTGNFFMVVLGSIIGVAIYGIYYNQIIIRSKWDHESGQTKKFDIN